MTDEPNQNQPVDEYLQNIDPAMKCTIGEVVNLMRDQLKDADQRVEDGKVVFSKSGIDLAAVATTDSRYQVTVSDSGALEDSKEGLGNVSTEGNVMQFDKLEDVRRRGFKELLQKLDPPTE